MVLKLQVNSLGPEEVVDQDQAAPYGAVWSDFILLAISISEV